LRKNSISNIGAMRLAQCLRKKNKTLIHLDLGCNKITGEGAVALFSGLTQHPTVISVSLANQDCYKNKNK